MAGRTEGCRSAGTRVADRADIRLLELDAVGRPDAADLLEERDKVYGQRMPRQDVDPGWSTGGVRAFLEQLAGR